MINEDTMKAKVWKHHVAEHFEVIETSYESTVCSKSTVFLDYDKMLEYLKKDGRRWYVAELDVDDTEIELYANGYMATLLVDKKPSSPFVPTSYKHKTPHEK